jgi:hypothetical protein
MAVGPLETYQVCMVMVKVERDTVMTPFYPDYLDTPCHLPKRATSKNLPLI